MRKVSNTIRSSTLFSGLVAYAPVSRHLYIASANPQALLPHSRAYERADILSAFSQLAEQLHHERSFFYNLFIRMS